MGGLGWNGLCQRARSELRGFFIFEYKAKVLLSQDRAGSLHDLCARHPTNDAEYVDVV